MKFGRLAVFSVVTNFLSSGPSQLQSFVECQLV